MVDLVYTRTFSSGLLFICLLGSLLLGEQIYPTGYRTIDRGSEVPTV